MGDGEEGIGQTAYWQQGAGSLRLTGPGQTPLDRGLLPLLLGLGGPWVTGSLGSVTSLRRIKIGPWTPSFCSWGFPGECCFGL